jgi:ABC-type microcin C transport system permease subunit YejB
MSEEKKGLNNQTIVFMIVVAIFFDVLQALLTFVFMGWLVGIFAGLTFYLWFRLRGMSFMKPKRFLTFGAASIIEMFPLLPLSALPAWTGAIVFLALDSKIKKIVPTGLQNITKPNDVLPFARRKASSNEAESSTTKFKKAA